MRRVFPSASVYTRSRVCHLFPDSGVSQQLVQALNWIAPPHLQLSLDDVSELILQVANHFDEIASPIGTGGQLIYLLGEEVVAFEGQGRTVLNLYNPLSLQCPYSMRHYLDTHQR